MNTSKEVCDKCNTRKDRHYRPMGNHIFAICPGCGKIRPADDIEVDRGISDEYMEAMQEMSIEALKSKLGW